MKEVKGSNRLKIFCRLPSWVIIAAPLDAVLELAAYKFRIENLLYKILVSAVDVDWGRWLDALAGVWVVGCS